MISIVVPARNEEKLLPGCLKSLRDQDYQGKFEILVVDNGSIDNTANIARDFGAKVVPASKNNGVFYARQVGAEAASGDIIVQADADTLYPRNWMRRIAEQFAAHPDGVAVAGRYTYRDKFRWAKLECRFRHVVNIITNAFCGRPLFISGATFAFRQRAFLAVNGYRGLTYSADQYGITGRLRKLGRIVYDKDLSVLTSSRSVQKPTIILVADVLSNLNRLIAYSCKNLFITLQDFRVKTPLRRLATWLLPMPILVVSLAAYGYFVPASPVFGKVYYKGSSLDKVVALTFDDGPNEPYTSQILDILASKNVKATFFIVGANAELYPDTTRRILAEGNVIGNHSFSHKANHALTDYGTRDLREAEQVIFNVTGVYPHLYRPPHGKKSPWELHNVKNTAMIEVTWSLTANDQHILAYFGKLTPETFTREIVKDTKPGEIMLLHDGYGTEHNDAKSDKSLTVKALPLIIDQLQAKGYRFVTVPELLDTPAYNEATP